MISGIPYSFLICNVYKVRELFRKAICFPTSKSNAKQARTHKRLNRGYEPMRPNACEMLTISSNRVIEIRYGMAGEKLSHSILPFGFLYFNLYCNHSSL